MPGEKLFSLTPLGRRVVEENMGLVGLGLALAAGGRNLHPDDRFQEASLALIHAVAKFDPNRGHTLATYAIDTIRYELGRAGTDRLVRVPLYLHYRPGHRFRAAAGRASRCVATGDPGDPEAAAVADPAAAIDEAEERAYRAGRLHHAIDALPGRTAEVVRRRMCGETLERISQGTGLTRDRVRRIEAKGRAALRKQLEGDPGGGDADITGSRSTPAPPG